MNRPIDGIKTCGITDCHHRDPHSCKIIDIIEKAGKRYLDGIDYVGFLNGKG